MFNGISACKYFLISIASVQYHYMVIIITVIKKQCVESVVRTTTVHGTKTSISQRYSYTPISQSTASHCHVVPSTVRQEPGLTDATMLVKPPDRRLPVVHIQMALGCLKPPIWYVLKASEREKTDGLSGLLRYFSKNRSICSVR